MPSRINPPSFVAYGCRRFRPTVGRTSPPGIDASTGPKSVVALLLPRKHSARMGLVRIVARLIACGVAVASLAVVVFAIALDRIAARAGVADVPPAWIAPFVFGAVAAPAVVGALVLLRRPGN